MIEVAQKLCTPLLPRANEVKAKFHPLFTHFSECHNIYNGNVVEEASVDQLVIGNHLHAFNCLSHVQAKT